MGVAQGVGGVGIGWGRGSYETRAWIGGPKVGKEAHMRAVMVVVLGSVVLVGGCSQREAPAGGAAASRAAIEAAEGRAAAAAQDLAGTLLPELQGAMGSGGAGAAIGVCAERAQELTAEVQGRHEGVRIRRTALRVRNPVNAPDDWERAWMEGAVGGEREITPASEVGVDEEGRREVRYVRPLVMAELCLKCHGPVEGIDPATRALIAERYPGDDAVGFVVGELRGLISVRVVID